MDLGPALHLDVLTMNYKRSAVHLLIFVVVLVILNLLLGEMDWGIHISILGSLVITLVVFGAIMFAHWFIFGVRPVPG